MPKIMDTTRRDGLRIVTKKLPYTNKVMISIVVLTGYAHDPKEFPGLFHFFEHMASAGTITRSAGEIARLLDRFSKENNAATGLIRTQYYGLGIKKNWKILFEILADMYQNPTFPEKEFEKERGAIKNEIARQKDDDNYTVLQNLLNILYRKNPAVMSGLGTEESISKISQDLLLATHRKFYIPSNTVVIVTGNISHEEVLEFSDYYLLGNYSKRPPKVTWSDEANEPPIQKGIIEERQKRETALMYLGVKLPNEDKRDSIISALLCDLIGEGSSSPLFNELRQKRGLVYETASGIFTTESVFRSMVFYAETLNKNVEEVKKLLAETVMTCELKPKLFEEMKEKKSEEATIELETASRWNLGILRKIVAGKDLDSLENYPKKLDKILKSITFDEVLELRKRILTEERMAFSILRSL